VLGCQEGQLPRTRPVSAIRARARTHCGDGSHRCQLCRRPARSCRKSRMSSSAAFERGGQGEGCGNVTECEERGEVPSTVAWSNAQPANEDAVGGVYPMVADGRRTGVRGAVNGVEPRIDRCRSPNRDSQSRRTYRPRLVVLANSQ
jgi:hypothetical protein